MKVKESVVFDLDTKMRWNKINNISELAFRSGVPYKELNQIYNNTAKTVNDKHIEMLCDFLKCDFHDLLSDYSKERLIERREFFRDKDWRKPQGILYFAYCEQGKFVGLTKIGYSKDVTLRMMHLENELNIKVDVIHFIPSNDVMNLEKLLHQMFHFKKVSGEWYNLTDSDMNFIKGKADGDTTPSSLK